jgi:glucose-6-phosphate 1-dehydrogenase
VVRGQYGAGVRTDGRNWFGYRGEPNTAYDSATETFVALRLLVDDERWRGMPIYLRVGKRAICANHALAAFKTGLGSFQNNTVAEVAGNRVIFPIAPTNIRGGHEGLILRCLRGDQTLFARTDLVEAACRIVKPIREAWAVQPPPNFPNYAAGTSGPREADDLLAHDGREWADVLDS